MRAVVFAYSEVGYRCLEVLLDDGVEVPLVLTHEDEPGEPRWFRSVAELAAARGVPVFAPADVNLPRWVERVREARPDAIFSFYYRKLLDRTLLDVPPVGAFNMHGSLLPAYRGRCPVNWALIHGETTTGVTLHEMIERPDAGDIVGQREVPVDPADDALRLSNKIADAAALLLRELLPELRAGRIVRVPQRLDEGSYFGGRTPEDGRIDWSRPAVEIHNLVRAVARPWPGAFGELDDRRLYVWKSAVDHFPAGAPPGTLLPGEVPAVACGEGSLVLLEWQLEGEKPRKTDDGDGSGPAPPGTRMV